MAFILDRFIELLKILISRVIKNRFKLDKNRYYKFQSTAFINQVLIAS